MAHLWLSFLGSFQVTLDGKPVTGFKSKKERALLAYLAVEADRPHRREMLAGLLWPDWTDRDALSNLRFTLSKLRQVIGDRSANPPFLLVTRDTLQFNASADSWSDVALIGQAVAAEETQPGFIELLEQAAAVHRGAFLEGFSLSDSASFEEWVLLTRERLARQVMTALHLLTAAHEGRGEHEQSQRWAWRQIELEPWDEAARRQLMRALALNGQRAAALAQYDACRHLLADELGVEPALETERLYVQIRDGTLKARTSPTALAPEPSAELPQFLSEAPPQVEVPVFVARDHELAQLDWFLELALAGQGRVAFVTGEAGGGKTALLQAFTRRAQELIPELIVANGNCSAYTGAGDPYLPFREILGLLTGDIEAHWAAATITQEHARRLWQISPLAAQALVEAGPDLLDTFVPRAALRERATMFAPRKADWLLRLDGAVERRMAVSTGGGTLLQGDIFEQYTRVLQNLAGQAPLLLVLDDLQWADVGSISLLFHLGRRLAGSRILILGAYRPEEVALGREGQRHPLEAVVNELQRDYGEIVVNLDQAGNRDFLEALLDSEPNRLGPEFREMFYRQTGGHPLFTIELLRGLQQRGDLSRDAQDSWVEGPKLDWEQLPARVEAVVAERIGRLPRPLQAALRVASVEGEIFTAEVVARLRGISDQEMLEHLSSNLDRQHRLVRSHSIQRVEGHTLSRYKFRHILFQRYLYGNLNEVERVHLHEQVGVALEELCGVEAQTGATAVQLALHFRKARITQKAIYYLCRAGERAVKLNAHQEALTHLTMGLDLLRTLPDSLEQEQQELDLQIALGLAWIGPVGYGPEAQEAFTRAAELCRQLGKASQLCQVVGHLATRHYVGGEHRRARQLAEEALSIAERVREPLLLEEAHWRLGFILFALGEYSEAHSQLQQVISFSEPEQHQLVLGIHPVDPRASALAYDACCLWCLGYPDQGFSRSQEAFAVARRLNHPLSLLDVVCYAGCMFGSLRRDGQALSEHAAELIELPKQQGFWGWLTCGIRYRGEALAVLGQLQEGLVQMREGVTDEAGFVRLYLSGTLGHLALAQGMTGHPLEGLTTLEEALAIVERTGERHWAAELHRLRGELLLMVGREAEAEASYLKAVEIARRQSAKSWELRATVSLCALWRRQGKAREASEMLRGIYGWFTEGFDSQDLREARALLQQLACAT